MFLLWGLKPHIKNLRVQKWKEQEYFTHLIRPGVEARFMGVKKFFKL
jgi:hypothetical protein